MKPIACLSLLLAAVAPVKSATVIQSFPFQITTPGTYVLNQDMTVPSMNVSAIQVSSSTKGAVFLDFQGHTLTESGTTGIAVSLGLNAGPGEPANAFPISIKNGILKGFTTGIFVDIPTGNDTPAYATDITIGYMEFDSTVTNSTGVFFLYVNNSTIKGCVFNGESIGITDSHSQGGNSYINDTFINVATPLNPNVQKANVPLTIGAFEYGE